MSVRGDDDGREGRSLFKKDDTYTTECGKIFVSLSTALPRVARLPVGDLARLAAVAAFAARAADGEGGLIVSRESAADVARSSTPCSNNGTYLSVTVFPMVSLTFHGTVTNGAACSTPFEGRHLVADSLTTPITSPP